jgi:alpha-L-fucosidase
MLSRRDMMKSSAAAAALLAQPVRAATGPVAADWQAFANAYRVPEWFRDAKFGIWSHWGPQCVPEYGDWYGRQMYIQGNPYYEHHVRTYGHPSQVGFMEIIGRWKAEKWDPEALTELYRNAGARYLVSMANHHDNFDTFDSAHHPWNSTRVGPKRDIVGTWAKLARAAGLRFGVSNHSSHAWHWWQTAYGYDAEGPRKGVRYDAFRLRKRDGKGQWWEGLDPQELYTGPTMVPPPGIGSAKELDAWHGANSGQWMEHAPPNNPEFVRSWLLRQKDLVEKYSPDLVYFDDYRLPFGQVGIDAVAHLYNQSIARTGGIDVVATGKNLSPFQRHGIVEDVERGFVEEIRPVAWQTCTCLGNWHYDRGLYERHGYKSAKNVVQRLADIVSKNGNLLLSVPQRGDGSIDSDEVEILAGLTRWFAANGAAIYGTRPWRVYGEGPTKPKAGHMAEGDAKPFTAEDVRFTAKDGTVNAIVLDWPEGETRIAALGRDALPGAEIEGVEMLGRGRLEFGRDGDALKVKLPRPKDGEMVPVLRVHGRGLA